MKNKKYHIITFGCQMNKSDSERIVAVLEKTGHKQAPHIKEADLIVVNMCSVRQSAVDRVYGLLPKFKELKTKNPELKTILTGCMLSSDRKKFIKWFDLILDIKNLPSWPKHLSHISDGRQKCATDCRDYLEITPKYKSNSTAFVPISTGCNNFCSYCAVPYTRGLLICRPHQDVLKEIKELVKKGHKEIWLLGQNVNDYHSPIDSLINFPKLLKMVNKITGDFSIRFTSPNPKNFSDELIETMSKCKKVAKYLNLPVQSGDNKILKKMNRPYAINQYKNLVKKIRKKIPDINLSTDVIVGFPGETRKQFENTKKLFEQIGFNMAYIAKYSPRPGTAAFQMKNDVPLKEKKTREKVLREMLKSPLAKKLIVILGPTSSGKTELSIKLAQKFNGEIVSADSRQVYKGMDIGTGKITKKEKQGIPHYLLDAASPKRRFTVAQYQKLAMKAMNKISKKGKIPFLVGGTGFYIQSITQGMIMPKVKPDWQLRKKLEKMEAKELFLRLKKLDPKRAKTIEKKNKRRLIRALEIIIKTKKPVPLLEKKPAEYKILKIGIKKTKKELCQRIKNRLEKRVKKGMLAEIKRLRKFGLSWQRLESFGLEYRFAAQYLQKKITRQQMTDKIQKESEKYAKRQMTWFKRDKEIFWIKNYKEAGKLVRKFLQ